MLLELFQAVLELFKGAHFLLSFCPPYLDHDLIVVNIYGYEFGSLVKLPYFLLNNYFSFLGTMNKA